MKILQGSSRDSSRCQGHEVDVLASPLPMSTKRSNEFNYRRYGLSVSTTSECPTLQSAFIERQSTIHKSLPPKFWAKKPKATTKLILQEPPIIVTKRSLETTKMWYSFCGASEFKSILWSPKIQSIINMECDCYTNFS